MRIRRSARPGSGSSRRSSARNASSSSTRRGTRVRTARRWRSKRRPRPRKLQALKTQAFMLDASGQRGQHAAARLAGAAAGPAARRAVHARSRSRRSAPIRSATIVLQDKFMSAKHAEIKAENGMWILQRRRLDQRHVRQQPSRRSPRARRQRLHQVRLGHVQVQEPMIRDRTTLIVGLARGRSSLRVATARADGAEIYMQVKVTGSEGSEGQGQGAAAIEVTIAHGPKMPVDKFTLSTTNQNQKVTVKAEQDPRVRRGHRDDRDRARDQRRQEIWIGNDDDRDRREREVPRRAQEPRGRDRQAAARHARRPARQQGRRHLVLDRRRDQGADGRPRRTSPAARSAGRRTTRSKIGTDMVQGIRTGVWPS